MALKSWRERAGRTLQQVADALGVTKSAIGDIEAGRRAPSAELALKIEGYTHGEVSADSLNGTVALVRASKPLRRKPAA